MHKLTENFRRFLDEDDRVREGDDPGFDKIDAAEHARKHWAAKEEEEGEDEEEEDELDLMGMQFDASEEQMAWARDGVEEGDDDHDDGEEGRGEDPERDAYWDKVVADRDEKYRKNPPELGMKGAMARRAKHRAGRNPNPPRPKFMREGDDKGRDGKKTSLLEIKRRRSKARRKQNK